MRKFLPQLSLAFAVYVGAILTGCGGSGGGGSDDPVGSGSTTPAIDPFKVDNYTEYKEGTNLSGIWMMIATTEYDVKTEQGTQHASESLRSTVFIKETNAGSPSTVEVSNPLCTPSALAALYTDYSGNNLEISWLHTDIDLTLNSYSHMTGTLQGMQTYGCKEGHICLSFDETTEANVEMIKIAPLPVGNWYDNFEIAAPAIGNINGVVQSDATTDAFEFDNNVNCFMHSKGNGRQIFASPMISTTPVGIDYENIVVSTDRDDKLSFYKSAGILLYQKIHDYTYPFVPEFEQRTRNFKMTAEGTNPININISADASNDASSDGAELDINIHF